MNKLSRSAVVIGSCAAALAAASPAAAAWSPPQELPGSAGRYAAFAAYGAGGTSNVGLYGPLGVVPRGPQAPIAVSTAPAAGAFGIPRGLRHELGTPVAVSPSGLTLAVGGPRSPLDYFGLEGPSSRLHVEIGPIGGRPRRIPTGSAAGTRTLASAIDDSGDAAVVFSRCVDKRCSARTVLATFRRRDGAFEKPVVLARRTGYPAAAVALNASGDAIVAWVQHRAKGRGNDVRARMRLAGGGSTKVRVVGPTDPVPTIAVTLTPRRHGTVAWFSEAVGEGSVGGPLTVSQKEMDSRGTIGSLHVLDDGTPSGHGDADAVRGARLRAVVGPDGAATYAWTGFVNGHYVVRTERLFRDVGDEQTLSLPTIDAQLMDLATDPAGDVIAVWASVSGTTPTPGVAAAVRPAAAMTFGAPKLLFSGADASGTAVGAIAGAERAIVAAGPEPQLGRDNPPAVLVSSLTPPAGP